MDQEIFRFGLAAFVTLLVVVDPPGVVPLFVALTQGEPSRRPAILTRAVLIALGVALFFLIAGRTVLSYLGVTVNAFSISGGILLFATAMPMLFGQRGGLQAPEPRERGGEDISVFPLAMPLLSGPGTIATILLLTSQAGNDMRKLTAIAVAIAPPSLAKNAGAQKAEEKPASSACHSYVQNPDGSWAPAPCQEVGQPTHTQHKSRDRNEDDNTDH